MDHAPSIIGTHVDKKLSYIPNNTFHFRGLYTLVRLS
jgi:hypothetical protein